MNLGLAGGTSAPRLPVIPSLANNPALIKDNASRKDHGMFNGGLLHSIFALQLDTLLAKDRAVSRAEGVMLSVVEASPSRVVATGVACITAVFFTLRDTIHESR